MMYAMTAGTDAVVDRSVVGDRIFTITLMQEQE
jgi:hypothetical protein